jgi:hypothetical protein
MCERSGVSEGESCRRNENGNNEEINQCERNNAKAASVSAGKARIVKEMKSETIANDS